VWCGREKPPSVATEDPRNRREEALRYLCPDDPNMPYDMLDVIGKVRALERGRLGRWLGNMVTGIESEIRHEHAV
jgi:acetyl-CoA carboxylase carboxyltransferase component